MSIIMFHHWTSVSLKYKFNCSSILPSCNTTSKNELDEMLTLSLHMGTDILVAIGMIANIFIAKEDVLHHPGGCSMSSGWMFCIIWVDVLHHWSRCSASSGWCSASSGWMFRIIWVDVPHHPGGCSASSRWFSILSESCSTSSRWHWTPGSDALVLQSTPKYPRVLKKGRVAPTVCTALEYFAEPGVHAPICSRGSFENQSPQHKS